MYIYGKNNILWIIKVVITVTWDDGNHWSWNVLSLYILRKNIFDSKQDGVTLTMRTMYEIQHWPQLWVIERVWGMSKDSLRDLMAWRKQERADKNIKSSEYICPLPYTLSDVICGAGVMPCLFFRQSSFFWAAE